MNIIVVERDRPIPTRHVELPMAAAAMTAQVKWGTTEEKLDLILIGTDKALKALRELVACGRNWIEEHSGELDDDEQRSVVKSLLEPK